MYDGHIAAMDEKDMKEGRVIRFVKQEERVIAEIENNIKVLKDQIRQRSGIIQKLQEKCGNHKFEFEVEAGEHQVTCKCCGMVL